MMATASLLWRSGTATASRQRPFFRSRAAFLHKGSNARSNAIQIRKNGERRSIPAATVFSENRYMTTTAVSSTPSSSIDGVMNKAKKPIPIVLLAGFLGAGKTSTLKHLLQNNVNVRIGTIVNDVASVNIDAKLVSNVIGNINNSNNGDSSSSSNSEGENSYADGGIVELQNGCACCSLADELLTSVIKLTDSGARDLDAIVVELSGVADPMSVRDNWEQARLVRRCCYFYTHTYLAFCLSHPTSPHLMLTHPHYTHAQTHTARTSGHTLCFSRTHCNTHRCMYIRI